MFGLKSFNQDWFPSNFTQPLKHKGLVILCYPPEIEHMSLWENKHLLQKCLGRGHVSCQEGSACCPPIQPQNQPLLVRRIQSLGQLVETSRIAFIYFIFPKTKTITKTGAVRTQHLSLVTIRDVSNKIETLKHTPLGCPRKLVTG